MLKLISTTKTNQNDKLTKSLTEMVEAIEAMFSEPDKHSDEELLALVPNDNAPIL